MKKRFSQLFLLFLMPVLNAGVVLVDDGVPQAEIVLDRNPTRAAQFAAAELAYHVKKITGAELPIVRQTAPGKKLRIHVGETPYTRRHGFRNGSLRRQEYLISVKPDHIVLMGHDREDRGTVDYADWKTFPDMASGDKFGQAGIGGFYEQGTCHAVYDFLERFCGVRWYLPTELGLEYVPRKTLTVEEKEIRRAPYFHHLILIKELGVPADFHGDCLPGGETQLLDRREAILWTRRMRLGGIPFACNHSLYGYYKRFLTTHPEWFAKGYRGRPPQLCYTSEGLMDQVAQDARDFFDGKMKLSPVLAHGDFFAVMPMDNLDICKCPDCQKMVKRDHFQGSSVYTDRLSRYYYNFVNGVARRLAKTHPGKYIVTAAYNYSSFPPENMKIESNVAIVMCLGIRQPYHQERRDNDLCMIRAWHRAAPKNLKSVWLYFCYPILDGIAGKYYCFPGFFSRDLIRLFEEFRKNGVRGYFIEPSYVIGGRNALLDQLELYLLTRLFDDPEQDGFQLREEFFRRYYGKAARLMETIYDEMEKVFCDTSIKYVDEGVQTQAVAWGKLGTPKRMRRWQTLLDQALRLANEGKEKKRVELFRDGVWKYMLAGQKAYLKTLPVRTATAGKRLMVPRLAPGDWNSAADFGGFYTANEGLPPRYTVNGKMLHDGKNLYIRMTVRGDPECFPRLKRAPFFGNDGWWLYFASKRDRPYSQLLISPDGEYTARAIRETVTEWKIKPVIRIGFDATAQRSVELTLPLASLLLDKRVEPGDRIFCNIIRANPDTSSAWIPPFTAGRDTPSRFGELILEK